MPPNQFTHSHAREALTIAYKKLFSREPTDGELDFGLSTAFHETQYGRAGGQFAKWASEGKYNWGALESGQPGDEKTLRSFKAAGLHPTKGKGTDAKRPVYFYLFPNDVEAAAAFLMTWGRGNTLKAAATGSSQAVAKSMRDNGYYEGFWVPPGNPNHQPMPPFKEAGSKAEAEANNIRDYATALNRNVAYVTGKNPSKINQVALNNSPSDSNKSPSVSAESFLEKITKFFSSMFPSANTATASNFPKPNSYLIIVGAEETETKAEYTRILQSVLKEELNIISVAHQSGNNIEVVFDSPFSQKDSEKMLNEICSAVSDTFEYATRKIGGCKASSFILPGAISSYPEMNVKTAEINRRKFQLKYARG